MFHSPNFGGFRTDLLGRTYIFSSEGFFDVSGIEMTYLTCYLLMLISGGTGVARDFSHSEARASQFLPEHLQGRSIFGSSIAIRLTH